MKNKILFIKWLYGLTFGIIGVVLIWLKHIGAMNCNWFMSTLPLTSGLTILLLGLLIANYQERKENKK